MMCDDENYYCPECPHCQEMEGEAFPASFGGLVNPMATIGETIEVHGVPGVGKSMLALMLALAQGRSVQIGDLSKMEPDDLNGLPARTLRMPEWLRRAKWREGE